MKARGFSLMEVVIALAILAISLTVLLQTQAQSLANAGRSRDLSIATMLARAKMIDLEQHLFAQGFGLDGESLTGDFRDEGHPEVAWQAQIDAVELDLAALSGLCGRAGSKLGKADKEQGKGDCESTLTGMSSALGGFAEEMGRSMRLVDLRVQWPDGGGQRSLSVHALLTRDDFGTQQESDLQRVNNQLNAPGNLGAPGTMR